ncbi:hypothetical protein WCD74_25115 [Actinomycetospora sp. OC33-EN08]|uniref:Yip1 domain-containing protein n=1 Tax=Actinomycetospora aurantiaca TaxID=3129233 RepID=A0ABU8MUS4_9PSEU
MATVVQRGRERLKLVRWGRFALDVEPAVYGTVVLMTVLAVALDDGVEDFAEVVQVTLGPLVATFAAHLFASVLAAINADRSPPSGRRLLALTAHAAQYLLLAIGPLLVVAIVALTGFHGAQGPEESVNIIIDLGWVVLVALGGVGGWRAVHRWWAVVLGAVGAFAVGFVVVILRIVLEH